MRFYLKRLSRERVRLSSIEDRRYMDLSRVRRYIPYEKKLVTNAAVKSRRRYIYKQSCFDYIQCRRRYIVRHAIYFKTSHIVMFYLTLITVLSFPLSPQVSYRAPLLRLVNALPLIATGSLLLGPALFRFDGLYSS